MAFGDYPALMDPATMGILSAAFRGLEASGPSMMPRSMGQIIGQAGQAGLGTFQSSMEAQRKYEQTKALVDLEKQKAIQAELATRVQFEDQNMRRGMLGLPPIQMPAIGQGNAVGAPAAPAGVQVPPMGGAAPAPSAGPVAAPAQSGNPPNIMAVINALPPEFKQAAIADIGMNGGKGLAAIIQKANEPIIGRESGIYKRDANGNMVLDPGWLEGEKERRRLAAQVEAENTLVDVPMPDGTVRKMRKADAMKMASPQSPSSVDFNVNGVRGTAPDEATAIEIGRRLQGLPSRPMQPQMPGFPTGIPTEKKIEDAAKEAAVTEAGKKDAETANTYRQKLPSMASSIVSLNQLEALNKDGNTYAAAGAEIKKDLGRIAQAFGIKINEKETANTEQYIARMAELLKERLASKDYGSGTGVSNLDLATAGVPLPDLAKTQLGRQKIIEAMKKDVLRSYNDMRGAVDYFEDKKSLTGFAFPSEVILKELKDGQSPLPKDASPSLRTPPPEAIRQLRMSPNTAAQFDQIFGAGAAAKVLGK